MARGALFKKAVRRRWEEIYPENFTNRALKERAGVTENTIARLWTGANPSLGTMVGVADALRMPVTDALLLMQGDVEPMTPPALDRIATALEVLSGTLRREVWTDERREEERKRRAAGDQPWISG